MNTFFPRQMTSKHPPVHLACMLSNPSRGRDHFCVCDPEIFRSDNTLPARDIWLTITPGSLRSIIDANRMSKMPSLPSRNSIYIRIVRLSPASISKSLRQRLFERGALHPARFFSQPYWGTEGLVALLVHFAGAWPIYGMW